MASNISCLPTGKLEIDERLLIEAGYPTVEEEALWAQRLEEIALDELERNFDAERPAL